MNIMLAIAIATGIPGIALSFTKYHMSLAVPVLCVVSLFCIFWS